MHSKPVRALMAACGLVVVSILAQAQDQLPSVSRTAEGIRKSRVYVDNESLIKGKGPFVVMKGTSSVVIKAFDAPDLIRFDLTFADFVTTLDRMCAVGATGVCFDIPGLSPEGASLSPQGLEMFHRALGQILWRRFVPILRVIPTGFSADAEARMAAVKTLAAALAPDADVLYLIEGPDAGALAAEFKRIAPDLAVAAPENGDFDVVTEVALGKRERPLFLVGRIALPDEGDVNYMVQATDENYRRFELANALPIELQPWTPDNSVLSEEEQKEGFISLFNGKDLSGWAILGENPNGFVARDGAIEWNEKGGSMLRSRDRYENFVLRMEWRIAAGKNNGLQVHLPRTGRGSKIGLEIQMLGYRIDPLTDQATGSVYDVVPPTRDASKEPGEWNTLELTIDWPHLKCVMNGEVVQDLNMEENPELKYRLRTGFIGMTDHGGYAAFRNIRLKPLPSKQ